MLQPNLINPIRSTRQYKEQRNNSPDNFQTPVEALIPLLPHLNREWLIWEPACGNGNLVNSLKQNGFRSHGTDIINGHSQDFLTTEYISHCIITNPPYSLKDEFLERCYELEKPFALLLPLTVFDSVKRRKLFAKHGVEVIFLPKRVSFETPNHEINKASGKKTSAWFMTCWITNGLNIGRQLTFSDGVA